jgi:lysophospholipase L1-like esterase
MTSQRTSKQSWAARAKRRLPLLAAALIATWATAAGATPKGERCHWTATWAAPPMAPGSALTDSRSFENQTVRHIIHVSVGGRRVRVRLSNAFGAQPLVVGAAHVALHGDGAATVPSSDRVLSFSDRPSITIPAGADVLSDPVELNVPTRGDLAVSIYVPNNTGPATFHASSEQTTYIAGPGDLTSAANLTGAETTLSRFWLSVVEVAPNDEVPTVVTIGDSITEGFGSTVDANHRWPDFLSARLNAPSHARLAVVNQGIGCGRLLHDFCGPSIAARFDRDVLAVTGVTHVVVLAGIVDIGLPGLIGDPSQDVSADDLIAGYKQLIARGHEKGLTIIGGTITPIGASTTAFPGFFTPSGEAKRQAVNQWIRKSGAFDGVIDFDAVMRDPANPVQMLPALNSGDGVHPNDAGYMTMANAIDLSLFR